MENVNEEVNTILNANKNLAKSHYGMMVKDLQGLYLDIERSLSRESFSQCTIQNWINILINLKCDMVEYKKFVEDINQTRILLGLPIESEKEFR